MNQEYSNDNHDKKTKPKGFENYANQLIADESLKELPGEQRGSVIIDRFIGSIVRHGEVQGRKASYKPTEVIKGMDYISKAGFNGLKEITSTEGLRGAVRELGLDADVAKLFGTLKNRLLSDKDGKYTLTSTAQIEGYLLAGADKNYIKDPVGGVDMQGDSWIPVVMEHTQRMVQNPNISWMTNSKAYDLIGTSAPLLKNTGGDWLQATSSARKAGVDVELLGRSAEKIQRRIQDNHDMGQTALALATGGRIETYKTSLDSRSRI